MKFRLRLSILLSILCIFLSTSWLAAQNYEYLAAVKSNGKWGFIDTAGKVAIPFQYDDATGFSEGKASVKFSRFWGYIDQHGKWVLRPVFLSAYGFHDNRAYISFFEPHDSVPYFGYVTPQGDFDIVLNSPEEGYDFADNRAMVRSTYVNGFAYGYKDTLGNWAIKPRYDDCTKFHEMHAAVMLGRKWGIIDTGGKFTVVPDYDAAQTFYNGLAFLQKGSKVSFIKPNGKEAFSVEGYEEVNPICSDGMVSFKQNGKMGFLNQKGKVAIKPAYDNNIMSSFYDGYAVVEVRQGDVSHFGFINKKGKVVIPAEFDELYPFVGNRALAKQKGKYGFINRQGKWAVQPVYEAANAYTVPY